MPTKPRIVKHLGNGRYYDLANESANELYQKCWCPEPHKGTFIGMHPNYFDYCKQHGLSRSTTKFAIWTLLISIFHEHVYEGIAHTGDPNIDTVLMALRIEDSILTRMEQDSAT